MDVCVIAVHQWCIRNGKSWLVVNHLSQADVDWLVDYVKTEVSKSLGLAV